MDVDIDFVSDPIPPADAWAENNTTGHAPEELDLEALVNQFLSKGGKIQEYAPGVTANPLSGAAAFNSSFYTTTAVPETLLQKRAEVARVVQARTNVKCYSGDAKLVDKLGKILDAQPARKDLLAQMGGMSDDRLQRLLRMYFQGDSRGDPYRKQTHETRHALTNPRDAGMAEMIRKHLDAGHTMTQTSTMTGYSMPAIRRIVRKYNLDVKVRCRRTQVVS